MRGQKAYGLYKFSSIFFLDSVYMSQNVLNSENFQIQVKKKVSCCLHMKLLWSSALENILIKIKLSSKAKEKGLNRGLSDLPCIKPTDIVLKGKC